MENRINREQKILVIALIFLISLFHYATEMQRIYYHLFYRELYFLPIILAGFWFGLKGGIVTSFSVTALYLPMIALNWSGFSPNDFDRVLETFLFNIVAIVLGLMSDRQKAEGKARIDAERMAREQAEGAARVKSDFLSITSHELRTPLISIIGYNDLLLDGVAGSLNVEQIDALKKIDRNSKNLLELINSMLDVSRLDAQSVELKSVDISQLIEEIRSENRSLIGSSGLNFVCNIDPQLHFVHTDPDKLKVILKNLIGNAIKFTERGGVAVDVRKKDNGIEFSVTDTGIGIPMDVLPIIFEPFRQVENPLSRQHSGVGLGLYVVKKFLEILQGTIHVDSEVGRGSTFRVWIPADEESGGKNLKSLIL